MARSQPRNRHDATVHDRESYGFESATHSNAVGSSSSSHAHPSTINLAAMGIVPGRGPSSLKEIAEEENKTIAAISYRLLPVNEALNSSSA